MTTVAVQKIPGFFILGNHGRCIEGAGWWTPFAKTLLGRERPEHRLYIHAALRDDRSFLSSGSKFKTPLCAAFSFRDPGTRNRGGGSYPKSSRKRFKLRPRFFQQWTGTRRPAEGDARPGVTLREGRREARPTPSDILRNTYGDGLAKVIWSLYNERLEVFLQTWFFPSRANYVHSGSGLELKR